MLISEQDKLRERILEWAGEFDNKRDGLIPTLQRIQRDYYEISDFAMQVITDALDIHPVEVYSVVSFYHFLDEKPKGHFVIRLCQTLSCDMQGKESVARQLRSDLGIDFGETTSDGMFSLEWTNCIGMCDQGPAMLVNESVFTTVTAEKVHEVIEECRKRLSVYSVEGSKKRDVSEKSRSRIGELTYSSVEPDKGLEKALAMEGPEIIEAVKVSGLRGRGGAGFPTSFKWELAAKSDDSEKFVVCNADEGEPGTFKDRLILSRYADLVFEGMTIAGLAMGAKTGIVYLRQEYSYLRNHIEEVLEARREKKLLGKNVGGREGFDFDIEIRMGSGAYVCGEETALIESVEGQRGEPRNRPPYPVDTGYNARATVVNNVETLAWVSCILTLGGDWFKSLGTERSRGLKIFSVSGDCEYPGVYEFPLGITVGQLMKEVGGENAKAAMVGGASGNIVPAAEFDRTIAFEDVPTGGAVIVLGPDRDILDLARNFMEFFMEESCGQCTPCREGNVKLLEGIGMLERGECSMSYLQELRKLGETMQAASKCGLGQTSPNAFLSMIQHFPNEIMGRG